MLGGGGEFAEVMDGLAMRERVVPDESSGRIGERVAAGFPETAARITARPTRERTLDVFGGEAAVGPLVSVRAQDAGTIGVVEQGEFADEFMFIGRHALAEIAERGVAGARFYVAKNLVVGAVFLDDVEDVLEHARLADALRRRCRRTSGTRGQPGLCEQRITQIRQRRLCERSQFAL